MSIKKLLQNLRSGDTFIGTYLRSNEQSETPEIYDFWCAVWSIGNIIGRRTHVNRPRAPVFLNWYVVLVAESGITRKSTAVRTATELVRSNKPHYADIIEGKTTPEKLEITLGLQTLSQSQAHGIISISELVTFMGRDRATMAMPGLLTDLYDSPLQRNAGGTVSGGGITMRNVFVSLLTASTPAWLQTSINPDVIAGGFTSRCIFVVSDRPKGRIAWPTITEGGVDELKAHIIRMQERLLAYPTIELSASALQTFTRWYNNRQLHDDLYRTSFESREDAHVLRLAACLSINDGTFVIESEHIKIATEVISDAKLSGYQLFSEHRQEHDRLERGIDHLRAVLVSSGMAGISMADLSLRMARYLRGQELRTTLRIMHELALVSRFELRSNGAGRPKTVWRAAPAITAESATEIIKQRMNEND